MHALIMPADIYVYALQAVQLTGWEYIHASIVPANTHCLLISPGPDQVTLMTVMHCGGGMATKWHGNEWMALAKAEEPVYSMPAIEMGGYVIIVAALFVM